MLPVADGTDFGGSLRNPAGWNNVFGFRTSMGLVPSNAQDGWFPSMSVVGPMARNVPDLAMLLSIQAGYDARAPLSVGGDGSAFQRRLESDLKGKRIAWSGDFKGYLPYEPGVLDVSRMDERGTAHHHERLSGPRRARWIWRCGLADGHSNRGTDSR
jgi:amidase